MGTRRAMTLLHDALAEHCPHGRVDTRVELLVDTTNYGVPGEQWCQWERTCDPNSAAVYPYKARVPGKGIGQWKESEIRGLRTTTGLIVLAAPLCECGCGQPLPDQPYGGYNSRLRQTVWLASNQCCARVEYRIITYHAKHPDVTPIPPSVIQQEQPA